MRLFYFPCKVVGRKRDLKSFTFLPLGTQKENKKF